MSTGTISSSRKFRLSGHPAVVGGVGAALMPRTSTTLDVGKIHEHVVWRRDTLAHVVDPAVAGLRILTGESDDDDHSLKSKFKTS